MQALWDMMMVGMLMTAAATTATPPPTVTNIAWANVATTCPTAYKASLAWEDTLARSGGANFANEEEATALYPLRSAAAAMLDADFDEVCVGSSASELQCNLAYALRPPRGTNIVSTAAAFPSVVYPWIRVAAETGATVRLADYDPETFYTPPDKILELIDEDTSIVALSHIEYISGQRYDLRRFADAAHAVGAKLIVDATQSLGVLPIDAHSCGADALVSSGYKWLRGTFGAAVGWLSPELLETTTPALVGFRSPEEMWDLDPASLVLPADASRWEHGSLHFGACLGLGAAVEELNAWGDDGGGGRGKLRVWSHSKGLADEVARGAIDELGLGVISPMAEEERSAIITMRLPQEVDAAALSRRLLDDHGLLVSSRAGLLRVSPHVENTAEDIEKLVEALRGMLP